MFTELWIERPHQHFLFECKPRQLVLSQHRRAIGPSSALLAVCGCSSGLGVTLRDGRAGLDREHPRLDLVEGLSHLQLTVDISHSLVVPVLVKVNFRHREGLAANVEGSTVFAALLVKPLADLHAVSNHS